MMQGHSDAAANQLIISMIRTTLQNGLLAAKRIPFTMQKGTYCTLKGHLLSHRDNYAFSRKHQSACKIKTDAALCPIGFYKTGACNTPFSQTLRLCRLAPLHIFGRAAAHCLLEAAAEVFRVGESALVGHLRYAHARIFH